MPPPPSSLASLPSPACCYNTYLDTVSNLLRIYGSETDFGFETEFGFETRPIISERITAKFKVRKARACDIKGFGGS